MISLLKQPLAFRLRSHYTSVCLCVSICLFFSLNLFADRHRHRHRRDEHSTFTVSKNLFAFLSTLLVFPFLLLGLFFSSSFFVVIFWDERRLYVCVGVYEKFSHQICVSTIRWYAGCACERVYMRAQSRYHICVSLVCIHVCVCVRVVFFGFTKTFVWLSIHTLCLMNTCNSKRCIRIHRNNTTHTFKLKTGSDSLHLSFSVSPL